MYINSSVTLNYLKNKTVQRDWKKSNDPIVTKVEEKKNHGTQN